MAGNTYNNIKKIKIGDNTFNMFYPSIKVDSINVVDFNYYNLDFSNNFTLSSEAGLIGDNDEYSTGTTTIGLKLGYTTSGNNRAVQADSDGNLYVIQKDDNTTYSSKTAASGGTDVSLVTTGEKYIWNSKTSNTGTITSIKTTAGAHTTINVTSGAANFNVPTKTSHLTNDSGFITSSALSNYLPLTGGNITGPVSFGSSVSIDEANIGDLVVNGSASFTNNLQANTINGVTVGDNPKFTDNNTTYSAGTGLSLSSTTFSVKLGYTTSGNNRAVQADSNGNLYVIQKDDNTYTTAYCSTAAATAAKTASMNGYVATANRHVMINITTANTAASALTMNINGTGAKPIYINGSASSDSNYTLPAGSYLVYYNGTNYYFRTDGQLQSANGILTANANTYVTQTANTTAAWRRVLGTYKSGSSPTTTITEATNVAYYDADGPAFNTSTGEFYTRGYKMYLTSSDALYTAINNLGWVSDVIES